MATAYPILPCIAWGLILSFKQFTQYIEKNDVYLVTVNNSKYWIYRYEGHLNGVDNAVVLFTFKNMEHYMLSYAQILNFLIKQSLNIIVNIC